MNAGRVNKNDLSVILRDDSFNFMTRGLGFVGNGGDFFANEEV